MTTVSCSKGKDGFFKEIRIYGHANFDTKGKDIVCAGISSIVEGAIFFFRKNNCRFVEIKRTSSQISFVLKENDFLTQSHLDMMIHQLMNISFFYPSYLKFDHIENNF